MHIVFWQNIVSPHQAGFMRALAAREHDVTVVAQERMSAGRQRLGWEPPALGRARLVVGPTPRDVVDMIHATPADTVHCIAGARVTKQGVVVAKHCRSARRRMGIISETPDPRGLGGWLRWGKYTAERLSIGRSYDFVLAMGETGVRWFRRCGYPSARVFPFCYVTEMTAGPAVEDVPGPPRFLFVGRLVDLKGVDVLLRALAGTAVGELDVVGDGPCREALQREAQTLGITTRVRWHGQVNPSAMAPRLAGADVLVLPSRKDGWGAVVNEALMVGTPVIASSACGASDLVRHDWLGTVVPAGDVAALRGALAAWASRGRRTATERDRIRTWADRITGESLASYIEAVFRHVYDHADRPVAPWRA